MNAIAIRVAVALLVYLTLDSYSALAGDQASKELKRMQASEFFDAPAQRSLAEAIAHGDLNQAQKAIDAGAEVNAIGRDGMTPLFWALAQQNIEGFRFLLEHGANPNVVVDLPDHFQDGYAGAIEMAARLEDIEYLRALLDKGADPNTIVNQEWQTPVLYRAILSRRVESARLLLERGADVDHRDKSGGTPLLQSVTSRQFKIGLLLLEYGADPTIELKTGGSVVDFIKRYGDRGIDKRTNDLEAYHQFVEELRERGLLD